MMKTDKIITSFKLLGSGFLILIIGCGLVADSPEYIKVNRIDNSSATVVLKRPSRLKYSWQSTIEGEPLVNRFVLPLGFKLTNVKKGSFAEWLRFLPLKPKESKIMLFDGTKKRFQMLNAGVVNIDVGTRDLQQCADAVIRLRSEYLYASLQYDKIHFNYTSGFNAEYSAWRAGKKIKVSGNKVNYYTAPKANDKLYSGFKKYLINVYNYAGTYSLNKELKTQNTKDIKAGDVLIIGGFPGHVVMVANVCENAQGEKAVLLMQSYMPAQSIHVVKKLGAKGAKVWFKVKDLEKNGWSTLEFSYESIHLKTWRSD